MPVTTSAFVTAASESVEIPITTTNAQGSTFTTSTRVGAAVITSTNAQGSAVVTTSPVVQVQVGNGGTIITSAPAMGQTSRGGNNNNNGGSRGSSDSGDSSANRASSGSMLTTTDAFGNSVVWSGVSDGATLTTTDARGRTVVTTITPAGAAVSALVLETTVLPNGQQSTITSLQVVGGQAAATQTTDDGPQASKTGKGAPGLQSALAAPTHRYIGEVAALVGGAIGVAALL